MDDRGEEGLPAGKRTHQNPRQQQESFGCHKSRSKFWKIKINWIENQGEILGLLNKSDLEGM